MERLHGSITEEQTSQPGVGKGSEETGIQSTLNPLSISFPQPSNEQKRHPIDYNLVISLLFHYDGLSQVFVSSESLQ